MTLRPLERARAGAARRAAQGRKTVLVSLQQ